MKKLNRFRRVFKVSRNHHLEFEHFSSNNDQTPPKMICEIYAKERSLINRIEPRSDVYFTDTLKGLIEVNSSFVLYKLNEINNINNISKTDLEFQKIEDTDELTKLALLGYVEDEHVILHSPKHDFFIEFGHDKCILFYSFNVNLKISKLKNKILKAFDFSESIV